MPDPIFEGPRSGAHLIEEIPSMSREVKSFANGNVFLPGEVVAEVAGEIVKFNPVAADGSENASSISYAKVDTSEGSKDGVVSERLTSVHSAELTWPTGIAQGDIDAAVLQLNAKNIFVRS